MWGLSRCRMLGDTKNALGFRRFVLGSTKTKRNSAKR